MLIDQKVGAFGLIGGLCAENVSAPKPRCIRLCEAMQTIRSWLSGFVDRTLD
jgi:hypothetical protein